MAGKSELLRVGQDAPQFVALDEAGNKVDLQAECPSGGVVLVFYPGDDTLVCTKQLCMFRDAYSELQAAGFKVFGVNPAGAGKHDAFVQKHRFPFRLIVDEGGKIAAAYGCRAILGLIKRTVYVIGADGKIIYAQRGNPPVSEVLSAIGKG